MMTGFGCRDEFAGKKYFCITGHPSGRGFPNGPYFGANTLISGDFHTFRPTRWVSVPASVKDQPAPCAPVLHLVGVSTSDSLAKGEDYRVIQPEQPADPIESVEIEAIFSKATQIIPWRNLQDEEVWRQGWV